MYTFRTMNEIMIVTKTDREFGILLCWFDCSIFTLQRHSFNFICNRLKRSSETTLHFSLNNNNLKTRCIFYNFGFKCADFRR